MAPDIRVDLTGDERESSVHRFRNFGEDVYRRLREECTVDLLEIDSATTSFHVRDVKRQRLRSTCTAIRDIADRHFFGDSLAIKEL